MAIIEGVDGMLKVTEAGTQKLFVHFKSLYVNRVGFEGIKKTQIDAPQKVGPSMSKKSKELATMNRKKYVAEDNPDVVQQLYAKNRAVK